MLTNSSSITISILISLSLLLIFLLNKIIGKKNKKQLDKIFMIVFGLFIFWILGLILQIYALKNFNTNYLDLILIHWPEGTIQNILHKLLLILFYIFYYL